MVRFLVGFNDARVERLAVSAQLPCIAIRPEFHPSDLAQQTTKIVDRAGQGESLSMRAMSLLGALCVVHVELHRI